MNAADYWNMFLKTGEPEDYLLYSTALKMEESHVPDDSGDRPQSNGLR